MPASFALATTQCAGTSQSSSICSSTRRFTASAATAQPSMRVGAASADQGPSASLSMFSRNSAPCAMSEAPARGASYSAHFSRVLPTSTARNGMTSLAGGLQVRPEFLEDVRELLLVRLHLARGRARLLDAKLKVAGAIHRTFEALPRRFAVARGIRERLDAASPLLDARGDGRLKRLQQASPPLGGLLR